MLEMIQRLTLAPSQAGVYFHSDFFEAGPGLCYRELPARVLAYADYFRTKGVQPGERVLFPFESSESVFLSFLGLLELGALPLSVKPYILSTPKEAYQEFLTRVAERHRVSRIVAAPSLDTVEVSLSRVPPPVAHDLAIGTSIQLRTPDPDAPAFVQFSSGSTSFPKGVPITYGKLSQHLTIIVEQAKSPNGAISSWLPLYHDMGLIGCLSAIANQSRLYVTEPQNFLLDPFGWWEFMSTHSVTETMIPNFAIDYSLKRMKQASAEEIAALDLSRLRQIYLGSEPINIENLEEFARLLAPAKLPRRCLKPCYGMAEAVLMVSITPLEEELRIQTAPNGQSAISVGKPVGSFDVRVAHESGVPCEDRELGQISIRGATLADKYFDRAEPLLGTSGYYETGDIGFFDGGYLFITGRINDRIKVNGQSYFASDFEQAVERLSFIRAGRTAVIQHQNRIVVLTEPGAPWVLLRRDKYQKDICKIILSRVGVTLPIQDVLFIRHGQITKTSSGKLQRAALAERFAQGRVREATSVGVTADLIKKSAVRAAFFGTRKVQARREQLGSVIGRLQGSISARLGWG